MLAHERQQEKHHEPALNGHAEALLRQLIIYLKNEDVNADRAHGAEQETVLETNVDGVHYILTRLSPAHEPEVLLSPREREVIRLVAQGLSNRAIATVLDISPWTVSTHLRRVFNKLRVSSRAEMVASAMSQGLVQVEG